MGSFHVYIGGVCLFVIYNRLIEHAAGIVVVDTQDYDYGAEDDYYTSETGSSDSTVMSDQEMESYLERIGFNKNGFYQPLVILETYQSAYSKIGKTFWSPVENEQTQAKRWDEQGLLETIEEAPTGKSLPPMDLHKNMSAKFAVSGPFYPGLIGGIELDVAAWVAHKSGGNLSVSGDFKGSGYVQIGPIKISLTLGIKIDVMIDKTLVLWTDAIYLLARLYGEDQVRKNHPSNIASVKLLASIFSGFKAITPAVISVAMKSFNFLKNVASAVYHALGNWASDVFQSLSEDYNGYGRPARKWGHYHDSNYPTARAHSKNALKITFPLFFMRPDRCPNCNSATPGDMAKAKKDAMSFGVQLQLMEMFDCIVRSSQAAQTKIWEQTTAIHLLKKCLPYDPNAFTSPDQCSQIKRSGIERVQSNRRAFRRLSHCTESDTKDTGGTCAHFSCSSSRGLNVSCTDASNNHPYGLCFCQTGYCAVNGRCDPIQTCDQNAHQKSNQGSCYWWSCNENEFCDPNHDCRCSTGYCTDALGTCQQRVLHQEYHDLTEGPVRSDDAPRNNGPENSFYANSEMKLFIEQYRVFMDLISLTVDQTNKEDNRQTTTEGIFWTLRGTAAKALCHYFTHHDGGDTHIFGRPGLDERGAHFMKALADQDHHPEKFFMQLMAEAVDEATESTVNNATKPAPLHTIEVTGTIAIGLAATTGSTFELKVWAGTSSTWSTAHPEWRSNGPSKGASINIDTAIASAKLAWTDGDLALDIKIPLAGGVNNSTIQRKLVSLTPNFNQLMQKVIDIQKANKTNGSIVITVPYVNKTFAFPVPPAWQNQSHVELNYLGDCEHNSALTLKAIRGYLIDLWHLVKYSMWDVAWGFIEIVEENWQTLAEMALAVAAGAGAGYAAGYLGGKATGEATGEVTEVTEDFSAKIQTWMTQWLHDHMRADLFKDVLGGVGHITSMLSAGEATASMKLKLGYSCGCGTISQSWVVTDGRKIDANFPGGWHAAAEWEIFEQGPDFVLPQPFDTCN